MPLQNTVNRRYCSYQPVSGHHRRPARRDRTGPDHLLPIRLGPDHPRVRTHHPAQHRRAPTRHHRRRRTTRPAADHRHHPGRHHRTGPLEHTFRTLFAKPLAAAIFLTINGLILLAGEALRRRAPTDTDDLDDLDGADQAHGPHLVAAPPPANSRSVVEADPARTTRRRATLHYGEAAIIGSFQRFALLAGISRSGIAMVGGLARGLSHRDAAHFSFLLATPVTLAAGVLKLPSLAGPAGAHIHGQVLVGAICIIRFA
jgi:hypothetical protein